MGDPKHARKKYETPRHPWIDSRIKEEKTLKKNYGLKNKSEVWKSISKLKRFKNQAKSLVSQTGKQADKEMEQMFTKMRSLGLLTDKISADAILELSIDKVMERRLQTILVKKGLARSMRQARQFITHKHVMVNGKIINSPGYLVKADEEEKISFSPKSPLFNEEHPERKLPEPELKPEEVEVLKKEEEATKEKEDIAEEITEEEEIKPEPMKTKPETITEVENENKG